MVSLRNTFFSSFNTFFKFLFYEPVRKTSYIFICIISVKYLITDTTDTN